MLIDVKIDIITVNLENFDWEFLELCKLTGGQVPTPDSPPLVLTEERIGQPTSRFAVIGEN